MASCLPDLKMTFVSQVSKPISKPMVGSQVVSTSSADGTKPLVVRRGESLPPRIRHWRIDKKLGKGATATVYLGTSLIDSSLVAIKQFSNDLFQNNQHAAAYRKMMMNEAHLVGKIIHPNILQTFSVGIESEQKYLVMEYVDGGSLEDCVNGTEALSLSEILRINFQCACALEYADEIGVIHRDIKPANILLAQGRIPKITDWGSSMKKGDDKNSISGVGSPAYMSPEQIREKPLNQQTDIYSLAVAMFELIAGKKPFSAQSQYETIFKILHEDTPHLGQFVQSALPSGLEEILHKAMAKNQLNRYLQWRGFLVDLSQLIVSLIPMEKRKIKIGEIEAFDWLRACPSLAMFQDNELWDLINVGEVSSMPCGIPITLHQPQNQSSAENIADERAPVSAEPKVTTHGFVLSGALQCYGEDNCISILRAGDYGSEITPQLHNTDPLVFNGFSLADTVILAIDEEKIQHIHPVVRDKLNKLIKVSAELQSKVLSARHSPEVAENAMTE